ncbi:UNVERIFIED_CONTAM: hypothetical protein K2H54_061010 [Gekko kuhli]
MKPSMWKGEREEALCQTHFLTRKRKASHTLLSYAKQSTNIVFAHVYIGQECNYCLSPPLPLLLDAMLLSMKSPLPRKKIPCIVLTAQFISFTTILGKVLNAHRFR